MSGFCPYPDEPSAEQSKARASMGRQPRFEDLKVIERLVVDRVARLFPTRHLHLAPTKDHGGQGAAESEAPFHQAQARDASSIRQGAQGV